MKYFLKYRSVSDICFDEASVLKKRFLYIQDIRDRPTIKSGTLSILEKLYLTFI